MTSPRSLPHPSRFLFPLLPYSLPFLPSPTLIQHPIPWEDHAATSCRRIVPAPCLSGRLLRCNDRISNGMSTRSISRPRGGTGSHVARSCNTRFLGSSLARLLLPQPFFRKPSHLLMLTADCICRACMKRQEVSIPVSKS